MGLPFDGDELPNAFRGNPNASYVDTWPLIWKEFKSVGYKTMFLEDEPSIGVFQYRLIGFEKQPTDFYGRSMYLLLDKFPHISHRKKRWSCIGGRPRYMLFLDYIHEFLRSYDKTPTFLMSHYKELTHNENERV